MPQVYAFRNAVQFTAAAAQIPKNAVLFEIGPHGVLRSPLRQCCPELPYVAAMKKGGNASETVPGAVCDLWRKGASFAWPAPEPCEAGIIAPERVAASVVVGGPCTVSSASVPATE